MTCYHPMKAWQPASRLDGGRLVFNATKALNPDRPMLLPCGQCIGCRTEKVEQWGTRCYHESQMHQVNSFITLTYDDDHLPDDYSVHLRTFQLFMKRLRKKIGTNLRFYGCGEYGDENQRPHYHALIFGYDFQNDRKLVKQTADGPLFTSATLGQVWPYGFNTIGSVTAKSANYCAGYIRKKIGGDLAASHYTRTHPRGHVVRVEPEFATQSTKPGIGRTWFDKYKADAFPSDFLVIDGKMKSVPLYYLKLLRMEDEAKRAPDGKFNLRETSKEAANQIKRKRTTKSIKVRHNATPERLAVREFIKTDRLSRLKRTL